MKKIITQPQKSDMGSGFGIYEFNENTTLKEFLNYYKENSKTWGTITIIKDNDIIRKFDYDIFNNNYFYYNIEGWQLEYKIKLVSFNYCFMNEDVKIFIKTPSDLWEDKYVF